MTSRMFARLRRIPIDSAKGERGSDLEDAESCIALTLMEGTVILGQCTHKPEVSETPETQRDDARHMESNGLDENRFSNCKDCLPQKERRPSGFENDRHPHWKDRSKGFFSIVRLEPSFFFDSIVRYLQQFHDYHMWGMFHVFVFEEPGKTLQEVLNIARLRLISPGNIMLIHGSHSHISPSGGRVWLPKKVLQSCQIRITDVEGAVAIGSYGEARRKLSPYQSPETLFACFSHDLLLQPAKEGLRYRVLYPPAGVPLHPLSVRRAQECHELMNYIEHPIVGGFIRDCLDLDPARRSDAGKLMEHPLFLNGL
ncbi:hypothetical protein BKA70DRAFT_1241006 [Coprinopsis sp. MPI-PUGE-AT-0042]|nr:hypothetical protein BKA70DRAFT_1241006 [Coprinopsis sp. MPI-PUGE-AT-0042]